MAVFDIRTGKELVSEQSGNTLDELIPERVRESLAEMDSEVEKGNLVLKIVQKLEEGMLQELTVGEERWLHAMREAQQLLSRCNAAFRTILEFDETLEHAILGSGPKWWRVGRLQDRIERLMSTLGYVENGVRSEWTLYSDLLEEFSNLVREFEADVNSAKDAA